MPGQFFYYEDEEGVRQDADIHEEVLDNPVADLYYTLRTIRQHVDDGNSLEDAVALFGSDELREAYAEGKFTLDDVDEALSDV